MLCKIADLIAEVPAAGGLAPRCKDYLWCEKVQPDIVIREEAYRKDRYPEKLGEDGIAYMESAAQFYRELVNFGGFYLHCSAVVVDGKAYLLSGHPGAGKSTHARLYQQMFPDAAVINDDKPALRLIDGVWYAYGTPWCGKDGINTNAKAPVAGVCFMKKASENNIRRLSLRDALERVLSQTIRKFPDVQELDKMLALMEDFLRTIPVYELENVPELSAARLSYETMRRGAEEAGL